MIRHLAGIAEIVDDIEAAVRFYRDVLGLTVQHEDGGGYAQVEIEGILHFGLWNRLAAAEATFGDPGEARRVPLGFTLGFEVDDAKTASEAATAKGWPIAQPPRTEPWGQTTSRFFSASGMLCEFSETPNARRITQGVRASAE